MTISNTTDATVVADAVLTEIIAREMRFAVDSPNQIHRDICMDQELVNTKRWSVPTYANFTTTVAATEGVPVDAQALTPTAVDIDTALWATAAFLGKWAGRLAVHNLPTGTIQALMNAAFRKLETDALGLASSMTNSMGSSATTMDADNFILVHSAFRTQGKRCSRKPLMVLSESAKRDLASDNIKNGGGIFSSVIGVQLANAANTVNQGEWVEFLGYWIASTDQIPTVSSGRGNFVCHKSETEFALGMAYSMPIEIELQRVPQNLGTYLVVSHAHGAGIAEQARCMRFLTKQ